MTPLLFFNLRPGLAQWRRRAASRHRQVRILVAAGSSAVVPGRPARRLHLLPSPPAICPAAVGIRVGEFIVGENGDHRILGHPDIRY